MVQASSQPTSLPQATTIQWPGLSFSQQQAAPPQEMQVEALPAHLIVVHLTPRLVTVQERADDQRYRGFTQPGDVNILSAGSLATCRWESPINYFSLSLAPQMLDQVAAQMETGSGQIELQQFLHYQDAKLLQISHWLAEELDSGGAGGRLYADSLINLLAVHLLRGYSGSAPPAAPLRPSKPQIAKSQITQAIDYLQAHLDQDISLESLAQAVHLSPSHLRRQFKQATGLAPHQYLIQIRVQRAQTLLQTGQYSIRDVATQVGFADQSHLNRHFKRLLGVTPKTVLQR